MNLYGPGWRSRAFFLSLWQFVCFPEWFQAIWAELETDKIRNDYEKFPRARTQDPPDKQHKSFREWMSMLPLLLICITRELPHFNLFTLTNHSWRNSFQKEISSNLTKVVSSFRTWLHQNDANDGASYRNKPEWSPQLTLFKQDLELRGSEPKHVHV